VNQFGWLTAALDEMLTIVVLVFEFIQTRWN
jgi:hypothetical protein